MKVFHEMLTETELLETVLFCWTVRRAKFTEQRWDTRDELLARTKRIDSDQLVRTTRDPHTPALRCTEHNGECFERLLRTVTNIQFCATNLTNQRITMQMELAVSNCCLFITNHRERG